MSKTPLFFKEGEGEITNFYEFLQLESWTLVCVNRKGFSVDLLVIPLLPL
jgi:hypothetical protein